MDESKPEHTSSPLARPVQALRGVGPERASQLGRLGIRTIEELLRHRPRRYEDRRQVLPIADVRLHEPAMVRGGVVELGTKRFARGRKSVFELVLSDGTARLHCRWWNVPYMQNYFQHGDEVIVFGKTGSLKPPTMDHPETEVIDGSVDSSIHLNRIAPVYPLTEGLPQRWLRSLIWRTLDEVGHRIPELWPGEVIEGFLARPDAFQALHFPNSLAIAEEARRRLAFDELMALQLAIQRRRKTLFSKAPGRPCPGDNSLIKPFLAGLGFKLTAAQTRVLRELRANLAAGSPMRRLLQGDVGSGKTVVAACCALLVLESGFNVALMAPTEILAEQHYQTFSRWFGPLGVPVQLQTSGRKTAAGNDSSQALLLNPSGGRAGRTAIPRPSLVVGTHALIEGSSTIENLGLVIIDEQHRFGVAQREQLVRKGQHPHLLVMTATPIPRTLGLTLYGDLDYSVIDQLPPGRSPVRTYIRRAQSLPRVWAFIRTQLGEGGQAFVVFPRIDDTGSGTRAVLQEFELLQRELAPGKVGLMHGRLNPEQKDRTMQAFRANEIQVLLCTSLIEVGIDVPNASVMMIENAEQFGLAQLHQLRGRIGRGRRESCCILINRGKSSDAEQRLRILAETADGFKIAEADLKLRGPGDLLGQQQSGLPPLQFADLAEDLPLVERARAAAARLVGEVTRGG